MKVPETHPAHYAVNKTQSSLEAFYTAAYLGFHSHSLSSNTTLWGNVKLICRLGNWGLSDWFSSHTRCCWRKLRQPHTSHKTTVALALLLAARNWLYLFPLSTWRSLAVRQPRSRCTNLSTYRACSCSKLVLLRRQDRRQAPTAKLIHPNTVKRPRDQSTLPGPVHLQTAVRGGEAEPLP